MNKRLVIRKLNTTKQQLLEYGVKRLGLFGSTVRGENTKDSDIDILVDFDDQKETYMNLIAVCEILQSQFKRNKLDIVTYKGLSPYIGKTILNEVEYV